MLVAKKPTTVTNTVSKMGRIDEEEDKEECTNSMQGILHGDDVDMNNNMEGEVEDDLDDE
jgi:hypothetical protein